MGLSDAPPWAERFARWLAERPGIAAAELTALAPLSGGAIQENWRVEARVDRGDGPLDERYVLRCDAPSTIAASLTRLQEFAVLQAVFAAGVRVPEPLWQCDDRAVIGDAAAHQGHRVAFIIRMPLDPVPYNIVFEHQSAQMVRP